LRAISATQFEQTVPPAFIPAGPVPCCAWRFADPASPVRSSANPQEVFVRSFEVIADDEFDSGGQIRPPVPGGTLIASNQCHPSYTRSIAGSNRRNEKLLAPKLLLGGGRPDKLRLSSHQASLGTMGSQGGPWEPVQPVQSVQSVQAVNNQRPTPLDSAELNSLINQLPAPPDRD
jgi:hypothetical protein